MGGLVAEELFFGETSSGVAGDLQVATTMAAQFVGSMGMAGSLFSYEALVTPGGNLPAKVSAVEEGREAIEGILDGAHKRVSVVLDEHRRIVEALRDALLERDELVGEEILDVIGSARSAGGVSSSPPVVP
jgi:ATP-dependent Zn protease